MINIKAFSLTYSKLSIYKKTIESQSSTRRYITTNIIVVGKKNSVEEWISMGVQEYEKRLRPVMNMNTVFLKSDEDLLNHCRILKGSVIALDENGKHFSSREFCDFYYQHIIKGGSTVSFIIGGFDGLPQDILQKYETISLSSMTWTHQMARLLLIEQIYRAVEIHKGSRYHKD